MICCGQFMTRFHAFWQALKSALVMDHRNVVASDHFMVALVYGRATILLIIISIHIINTGFVRKCYLAHKNIKIESIL